MFDTKTIGAVIGKEAFTEINVSDLPKIETMTLLHIWTQSSGGKLMRMAQACELLPLLKVQHRDALDLACELRIHNPHLTQTECLQAAGLPLFL